MVRFLLVVHFIAAAVRHGIRPWRFFQLNSAYFNEELGIFSKLEVDQVIPERFRLWQILDDGSSDPGRYPVFVKPEWGQNGHSIRRADSLGELAVIRAENRQKKSRFLLQEVAPGAREFEVFYVRSHREPAHPAILSVTEVSNGSGERFPINSVHNPHCSYHDLDAELDPAEREQLWRLLEPVGCFRMARVGLKADSVAAMVAGQLHIVEINIYLPMPLSLLDRTIPLLDRYRFLVRVTVALAKLTGTIPSEQRPRRIFFPKLLAHYRVKS